MAKIYVASSWRNQHYASVVNYLKERRHEVYDFKNPPHGNGGFSWADIDENWINWNTEEYKKALEHPIAEYGFNSDFTAMQWADVCVLVLPCGRSANSEAGWMKGAGKHVIVFQPENEEPELMYKLYDDIVSDMDDLLLALQNFTPQTMPVAACIGEINPSRIEMATRIVAGIFASGNLKYTDTNKGIVIAAYELADELVKQGSKKE